MMAPPDKSSLEWANMVRRQNVTFKGTYPEMIIYHGQNDPVVNFRNSTALIAQWTYLHKTDTVPDLTENEFQNNKDITKYTYHNNDSSARVIFYKIANLGHRLLVDPGSGEMQGGATGLFAVDKDFFSTYWILKDFGIIEK
jgi:feruloyl esterase